MRKIRLTVILRGYIDIEKLNLQTELQTLKVKIEN